MPCTHQHLLPFLFPTRPSLHAHSPGATSTFPSARSDALAAPGIPSNHPVRGGANGQGEPEANRDVKDRSDYPSRPAYPNHASVVPPIEICCFTEQALEEREQQVQPRRFSTEMS